MAASVLIRSAARAAVRVAAVQPAAVRTMAGAAADIGVVPGISGLTGKARKEAVFKEAFGEEYYDRDAKQYLDEGSRENPIPILSVEPERVVGISLPDDAEVRWFTLKAGVLAYDPDTSNFFALKVVSPAEVDEWVARAEKQVFGASAKQ